MSMECQCQCSFQSQPQRQHNIFSLDTGQSSKRSGIQGLWLFSFESIKGLRALEACTFSECHPKKEIVTTSRRAWSLSLWIDNEASAFQFNPKVTFLQFESCLSPIWNYCEYIAHVLKNTCYSWALISWSSTSAETLARRNPKIFWTLAFTNDSDHLSLLFFYFSLRNRNKLLNDK